MKKMFRTATLTGLLALTAAVPATTWACDGAGPSTHIGNVVSVDSAKKTFTITDAQLRMPITFMASTDIIDALKEAKGSVMVNYQEDGDALTAVGVTF